jgi:hypothetical protein
MSLLRRPTRPAGRVVAVVVVSRCVQEQSFSGLRYGSTAPWVWLAWTEWTVPAAIVDGIHAKNGISPGLQYFVFENKKVPVVGGHTAAC